MIVKFKNYEFEVDLGLFYDKITKGFEVQKKVAKNIHSLFIEKVIPNEYNKYIKKAYNIYHNHRENTELLEDHLTYLVALMWHAKNINYEDVSSDMVITLRKEDK